jgi:MFS family permease
MDSSSSDQVKQRNQASLGGVEPVLIESASFASSLSEKRLISLIAICFLTQGISQHFSLLSQPLNSFLKDRLALSAFDMSCFFALLMFPWVIKPIYGIICDTIPGQGRGRLSYLFLGNLVTALLYVCLALCFCAYDQFATFLSGRWQAFAIVFFLFLGSTGMALVTVVTTSLSASSHLPRRLFGLQGFAYYLANIPALILGGYLAQSVATGTMAQASLVMSGALVLAALPALVTAVFLWRDMWKERHLFHDFKVSQEKSKVSLFGFIGKEAQSSFSEFFSERHLKATLIFLALWNFSPSLGTGLYFYERNILKFSPELIANLAAVSSFGMLIGSLLYGLVNKRFDLKWMAGWSILASFLYVFLQDPLSAFAIEFFRGFSLSIFTLFLYSLAAEVAPVKNNAFAMALFICFYNLANELGMVFGGLLYSSLCERLSGSILPLIAVSIATTLLSLFCIPFMKKE